jgi:2-iminobutanoate/2-iminopropanoate deaminase
MARREIVSTDRGPRTGLLYSQAVRFGELVFVAGQVALDPATGQLVEGGVGAQTRRVLDNVQAILRAAGTSLDHAVETTCFLRDVGDFAAFNDAYRGYFPKDPPARTTVQAVLPREGLMVEIRVVAAMPGRAPARPAARRPAARTRRDRRAVRRRR